MEATTIKPYQYSVKLQERKEYCSTSSFKNKKLNISHKFHPIIHKSKEQHRTWFTKEEFIKDRSVKLLTSKYKTKNAQDELRKVYDSLGSKMLGSIPDSLFPWSKLSNYLDANFDLSRLSHSEFEKITNEIAENCSQSAMPVYMVQSCAIAGTILTNFPPGDSLYITVGRSPALIHSSLELISGGKANILCLPFSKKGLEEGFFDENEGRLEIPRREVVFQYLEKFFSPEMCNEKKLVLIDLAIYGKSIYIVHSLLCRFFLSKPEFHDVAIHSIAICGTEEALIIPIEKPKEEDPTYGKIHLIHDECIGDLTESLVLRGFSKYAVCVESCRLLSEDDRDFNEACRILDEYMKLKEPSHEYKQVSQLLKQLYSKNQALTGLLASMVEDHDRSVTH